MLAPIAFPPLQRTDPLERLIQKNLKAGGEGATEDDLVG